MPFVIPSLPPPKTTVVGTAAVVPHFTQPFTLSASTGATVDEQDTHQEVFACVVRIVSCPIGAWADRPAFGIPSPLFAAAPIDTATITNAIAVSEPRAKTIADEYPDLVSDAFRHVRIRVSPAQADQ